MTTTATKKRPTRKQRLKDAIAEHARAEKDLSKARKKLRTAIMAAQKHEMTMTEIASTWGVSRQSVYKILRNGDA